MEKLHEMMLKLKMPEGQRDPGKMMMKGLGKLFVLFMLRKKPMHGYAIIKLLNEEHLYVATPGRVYPWLRDLEEAELVAGKSIKGDKRMSKEYKITEKGRKLLEASRAWFGSGVKGEFFRYMVK